MRIVLQRVKRASVTIQDEKVAEIGKGLLLFVGFEKGDSEELLPKMAEKCAHLRVFEDANGKMNLSAMDLGLPILAVSNFTLVGNTGKGRRPSFDKAENQEKAQYLFEKFLEHLERHGLSIQKGVFRARMEIELVNDGPVTFVMEGN